MTPSKNYRVLHVLNQFEHSGAEINLLQSAQEWQRHGFSLDLLATGPNIGPLSKSLTAQGYRTFHIPLRSKRRFAPRADFITRFMSLCRANKYDVLHIHTESAYYLFALLGKLAGIPRVVRTVHNTFTFKGPMRQRKILERAACRSFLGLRSGLISSSVEDCEWKDLRNPGVRIDNWFDTNHFRPATESERIACRKELGCRDDEFVITSVGNCAPAKNHPEFLRALSLLGSEVNFLYLHVGSEPEGGKERQMATELGIAHRVRFVGRQPDPKRYLWASDAFAMPSLWEGFSIAALEAMGTGVPLLLTNVNGLRDLASAAKWVELVEPDARSIADGILRLFHSPAEEIRGRARQDSALIRERYSIANGVRRIITALYGVQIEVASLSRAIENAIKQQTGS